MNHLGVYLVYHNVQVDCNNPYCMIKKQISTSPAIEHEP